MVTEVKTINDVAEFAKQIISEGVSFHPHDDFNDYINFKTNKRCYSRKEADFRKKLMEKSFKVCEKEGVDIYDLMLEVSLIETGMDKYILLPSAPYSE